MRTLVTGPWPALRQQGFTLLELMLVMVLLGIVFAVAVPRLPWQDAQQSRVKLMEALGQTLMQQRRLAILSGRPRGLRLAADGLQILQWQQGQWQALRQWRLPSQFQWQWWVESQGVDLAKPANLSLLLANDGSFSPFKVRVSDDDGTSELTGDGINAIGYVAP